MGCDIHLHVEVKDSETGTWKMFRGNERENPYYDAEYALDCPGSIYAERIIPEQFYAGRNYDLFAILADVRNGYGFAGCDTGDGFVPICKPKGLPEDLSPEVRGDADHWGWDGHSHSWHTLVDLQKYDWDRTTKLRGYVSPEAARMFKETGELPGGWCGWTSQEDWVQLEWPISYRECVKYFLERTMKRLEEVAEEFGGPDNVRIVFWFDN